MNAQEIVEAAPHPTFLTDEKDRVVALNPTAEEFLGVSGDQIRGRAFHAMLAPRDVYGNRVCPEGCGLHEMVCRGEPIQAFDLDVRASGRPTRVAVSVVVVFGPEPDRYHLVYHLVPRRRRRRTDEAIDLLLKGRGLPEGTADPRRRRNGKESPQLTRRERQVLEHLVAGESTQEITQSLEIKPNTLRTHTQRILRKLGVRSRVEAVAVALRQHLV